MMLNDVWSLAGLSSASGDGAYETQTRSRPNGRSNADDIWRQTTNDNLPWH